MSRGDTVRVYGVRRRVDLGAMTEAEAAKVIAEHDGLVWWTLRKLRLPAHLIIEESDLISAGRFALLQAWATFDPSRARFSTWASTQIRQVMIDLINGGSDQSRGEQRAIGLTLRGEANARTQARALAALRRKHVELPEALTDGALDPEAALERVERVRWLRARLANGLLSAREKAVMAARMDGRTLGEIAGDHGVSREWVRQIERGVLIKLKHAAKRDGLCSSV